MLVAWSSKKQFRQQQKEVVHPLLFDLGVKVTLPMKIFRDNQGASFVANNLICHSKMKYVAMDFHFIQEKSE